MVQKKAVKAPAKPIPAGAVISVAAEKEGFRRAGRAWSKTPTEVPVSDFTEEQLQQLFEEPMLTIKEVVKGKG